MKKIFLVFVAVFSGVLGCAQGDSFNFIVHNKTHLETKQEYSIKTLFPIKDKAIHDIRMDLHLGCPDGKCSDWDYSINVVMRKVVDGDTLNFQLGRMITPYSGWYNRGENAKTWDKIWSWNITEYLPLMHDSVEIIVSYEGYQDGFLATTDFVFNDLKHKKAPQFIDTKNVYFGYFPFGREDSTIDEFLPEKELIIPKGTQRILARMTVSGHGGDKNNAAAEFLEKAYYYYVNEKLVASQSVWKDDCGCNPIQPQGGTWIYNRAAWCPGTKVDEHYYDLTPFVKDGKLKIRMNFDYYNGHNSGDAGYQIANDIFFIKDKDYEHNYIEDEDFNLKRETLILPKDFVLAFKTNEDARDRYKIAEQGDKGRIVYERSQFSNNEEYLQAIHLEDNKNYNLIVLDEGCDGLSWWANPQQGDGYVLIYDKDTNEVIEAFDPDFGCILNQAFITQGSAIRPHKANKCICLKDEKKEELRIIFFNKNKNASALDLVIRDRKTGDTVYEQSYEKQDSFDIKIDYKTFKDGYYQAKITCNGSTEYFMFIKMKED